MSEPSSEPIEPKKAFLFHNQAVFPWPYLIILPVAFIFLIAFGWTQDDIVEREVNNIWIPREGDYAKDVNYAKGFGVSNDLSTSSFAAMAIARDGGNLFTEERLSKIRDRMELMEKNTTVSL